MKTVIGLFEQKDEAMRAFASLVDAGYARADLDILTNDDKDDVPKLARMHSWVPEPDVNIYLAGVRDGGTIVTANVGNSTVARAASILGSYNMVNIGKRAPSLAAKAAPLAAAAASVGAAAKTVTAKATQLPPKQTPATAVAPPTRGPHRSCQERQRAGSDRGGSERRQEQVERDACASTTSSPSEVERTSR
jgi:hypothetical protein